MDCAPPSLAAPWPPWLLPGTAGCLLACMAVRKLPWLLLVAPACSWLLLAAAVCFLAAAAVLA